MAEGNGLLNRHRGKTLSRVQIPPSPPFDARLKRSVERFPARLSRAESRGSWQATTDLLVTPSTGSELAPRESNGVPSDPEETKGIAGESRGSTPR